MRSLVTAAGAVLFLAVLGACVPQIAGQPAAAAVHPNLIIVREFAFSPGIVTLDPSLGFSLYRGERGVPPSERAMTVGRAASFTLADTIATRLAGLGYDVVHSNSAAAEAGGRALIVNGAFTRIYEGHRRQGASVAVAAEIDYQAGRDAPRRLSSLSVDSRRTPALPITAAARRRGSDVNVAADRTGEALARYVADLARLNRWPSAPR